MREVASLAGVSIATVSYAIRSPSRVSATTREKVQRAIDDLGFVVNSAARSMRTGGTPGMGVVVGDLSHSFSVGVVRGAQAGARDSGATMLIANADRDDWEQSRYIELFDQARLQGIILAPLDESRAEIARLREHGSPVVVVNYRSGADDHCTVLMDNDDVGYRAADHLISLGCRRLVFATGYARAQPLHERRHGIERAVADRDGVGLDVLMRERVDAEDGRAIARRILATPLEARPDGVIAATEIMALGLLQELAAEGVRVPEDMLLISTEEDWRAVDAPVRISRLKEPAFEMGRQAAVLLADEIANPETHRHRTVTLAATLFAAESTLGRGAPTVEESPSQSHERPAANS